MRSDRDKRTDTEKEIDDFLSRFENPVDEMSDDIDTYLDDADDALDSGKTFSWEKIDAVDNRASKRTNKRSNKSTGEKASKSEPTSKKSKKSVDTVANDDNASDKSGNKADPKKGSKSKTDEKPSSAKPTAKKKKKKPVKKKKKPAVKPSENAAGKAAAAAIKKVKNVDRKTLSQKLFYRKNKKGEYKFSLLMLLRDFVALGIAMVLAVLLYFAGIIALGPKYDFKDVYAAVDTSSIIFDDEGKQIDNVYYTENRKIVKYEDMPEDLVNSFIAIEDKTFWKHHGFNWTRMFGAILSSLTGNGRISGTSTITQQLARNVYLADTKSVRSIKRKVLEMYYASRLEHALSKEEIIEAYLNTIYLGHGCYGVNSAAKTYFSKKVKNLDLVECASLAALPQSPDTYALLKLASEAQNVVDSKVVATEPQSVVTNDIAKERRQLCLDLMLQQKMITQDEHDSVYNKSLNDFIKPSLASTNSVYTYFHEYLVDTVINDLMEQYDMTYEDAERMVYTKGLKIYSTVDSTAQKVVVKEFKEGSYIPSISGMYNRDADNNILNNDGKIVLYDYDNDFDKKGNFRLKGADGDVSVNNDGSITINSGNKLNIYETETAEGTDYSLEFKNYYVIEDGILYSIAGGYVNIPMAYKSCDVTGHVIISADFFNDPNYEGFLKIDGDDVIITKQAYTLSTKTRQPQAAMTIVGVGTGEVKAMVGGRQFGGQKLLNRCLNPRQPGSSIKPLAVYGAALQKSYELHKAGKKWTFTDFGIDQQGVKGWGDYITVHSSVADERTKINGQYWPKNATGGYSGSNTFMTAIQQSINTCAVKILLQVGADYSIEQVKKFGITTLQDDTSNPVNDENPAALALGAMTQGVTPLEMALAYASFPGEGKVNTPICYYKVEDRDGEVILEGKSEQSEAIDEGVAFIMRNVLQTVITRGIAGSAAVSGTAAGGKTGTTNDQYDIWFDGFTPSYAGSLWIGTDENISMSSMSGPAAAMWGHIMSQIPKAKVGEYPEQPDDVVMKNGLYYTTGTETGLSSYKTKADREKEQKEKEKAQKEAYNKWLKERESHKVWVVDKKAVYKEETVKIIDQEGKPAWDEQVAVGSHEEDILDADGNPTGEKKTVTDYETRHHDAVPEKSHTETRKVKVSDEVGHWEYEKGWKTYKN